jgi:hypothetical protein
MCEETIYGFPKGRVAETIRKILHKDLNKQDIEVFVVCLSCHLLIESSINDLLYRWLCYDIPQYCERSADEFNKAKDLLFENISKMPFAQKYSLIHPIFTYWFPDEAKDIWEINGIRNNLFHGKSVNDVMFKGFCIRNEEGIEKLFMISHNILDRFIKLDELIESPHIMAKKWGDRLLELGESLF